MSVFKFEDIAVNSTEKKKPVDQDKHTYLGLEHLDSDSIYVTRFGAETAPKGDKLIMKKGDVLFGKRRAYQKKVAIAPFDGIFSAHGMVLRPKEEVIDKNFFPMFIKSDYFLDAAIKISVGSLSPTINWRDLKELKFELPSLEEQRKLAKVLWAIYDMKDKYKKLILATDNLVKSQFIEMFKDEFETCLKLKMNKAFDLQMGKTPSRADSSLWQSEDQKWVSIADMSTYEKYTEDTKEYISDYAIGKTGMKIVPANTVIMSFKLTIGRTAITSEDIYTNEAIMAFIQKSDLFEVDYLRWALHFTDWLSGVQNAVKGSTLNKSIIGNMEIPIPSKALQNKFLEFAEQSDKSKCALQEAIKDLDALSKKIIAENLIPAGKE